MAMLRVAVPPFAPRTLTKPDEPKLKVGALTASEGLEVRVAVSVTFPAKPLEGLTATVLAPLLP